MGVCVCSSGVQPSAVAVNGETDILNVDTNRRMSRTQDRVVAFPPLIIRHVAAVPGCEKSRPDREQAASAGAGLDALKRSGSVDSRDRRPRTGDDENSPDVDREAVGDGKDRKDGGSERDDADAVSCGRTATRGADRALCAAPFTHASRAVSLMASEVVVTGGGDSDDETGDDGSRMPPSSAAPPPPSKSPLGSSSSGQPSGGGRQSVQQMLRQIRDDGERINERLFGGGRRRRRLPTTPTGDAAAAGHDSDALTSCSQSAKSDASGEAEHRPVRSVLEELPRPAARSPRSLGKRSVPSPAVSRQLPDPSAIMQVDDQPTVARSQSLKLADCPPSGELGTERSQQLRDLNSALCSRQVDDQPSPMHLIRSNDVPEEGKQPEKVSESRCSDVVNAECRQLPNLTTETSVLSDNHETAVRPVRVSCDMLTHSDSLKLLYNLAESTAGAENEQFPVPSATKCSVPVDSEVARRHLVRDSGIPPHSFDSMASESCQPQDLNCSDSLRDGTTPVSNFTGRGVADGESPRNTISDEVDGEIARDKRAQSDVDNLPSCPETQRDSRCAVLPRNSETNNPTFAQCFWAESDSRKIRTVSKRSSDLLSPEYWPSSVVATNAVDFVTENELKHDLTADAKHVSVDARVKLETHPSQTSVMSPDLVEILHSGKGDQSSKATVNDEQSLPETSSQKHANMTSCELAGSCAHLITGSRNNAEKNTGVKERLQSPFSLVLHTEKPTGKDIVAENATAETHVDSSADKLKSARTGNSESHCETNACRIISETSALRRTSIGSVNELLKPNTKSSEYISAGRSRDSPVIKADEPFCLSGPRRALSSQNICVFASSSSAALKAGGNAPSAAARVENFTGNIAVKNNRLSSPHVPIIRSKNAANATVVSSAADEPVAVSWLKPGSVAAVNVGPRGLSRMTRVPPHVRLSTYSPQPPTEPASRPAVAATQARFVCFLFAKPLIAVLNAVDDVSFSRHCC